MRASPHEITGSPSSRGQRSSSHANVAATYERASGARVGDLRWYEVYAALRHAIVMARIQARAVHFGEATLPEDLDATIMHRPLLEAMLSGTYWT